MTGKLSLFSFWILGVLLRFPFCELASKKKTQAKRTPKKNPKKMKKGGKSLPAIPCLDTLETTFADKIARKCHKIGVFVLKFAEWFLNKCRKSNPPRTGNFWRIG